MCRSFMCVLIILIVTPVFSQDLDKGIKELQSGIYDLALKEILPLAKTGDRTVHHCFCGLKV